MSNAELRESFSRLSTPLICDACLRSGVPYDVPHFGIRPLRVPVRIAGRAWPARHSGSVDVFLEAIETAEAGDILVIDNGGRLDEACIEDLIVLEAQAARLGGVVVWGLHRDAAELAAIDLAVFTYGAYPTGPRRLDPRPPDALTAARFGATQVDADDFVVGDDDGLVFAPLDRAERIFEVAQRLSPTERDQAQAIRAGKTLRSQLRFGEYLETRGADPSYTLRRHLRQVGGAVEE